jgi:hypothetical protein
MFLGRLKLPQGTIMFQKEKKTQITFEEHPCSIRSKVKVASWSNHVHGGEITPT